MKYTNTNGYPPHIVALLTGKTQWAKQKLDRLRVTQTDKPIQALGLMYQRLANGGEIAQEDVVDLYKRRLGTIIHEAAELSMVDYSVMREIADVEPFELNKELSNKGLFLEVPISKKVGKLKISGRADVIWDGCVRDIKTTSMFSFGKDYSKHIWQLSVYRALIPEIITKPYGYIDFVFTDYHKKEDLKPIESVKVDLFPVNEVRKILRNKVAAIMKLQEDNYKNLADYACSEEDIYFKPPQYKVWKKEGGKRALKSTPTKQEAIDFIQEKSKPEMYEIRKETSTPCTFCDEKINCKQYAMLPKES